MTLQRSQIETAPLMHIQTYDQLSEQVAHELIETVKEKPNACLALPTGKTPLGTYRTLTQHFREDPALDWSKTRCFALDEYLEIKESDSFQTFLLEHLYQKSNIAAENTFSPAQFINYDEVIEQMGGLDLTLLGIGQNGHIAFNEPETCPLSFTHCTWLEKSTLDANRSDFSGKQPDRAITVGIETILRSRRIILIAAGNNKKEIVEQAFSGEITRSVPASFLQKHQNLQVLTDFGFSLDTTDSWQESKFL